MKRISRVVTLMIAAAMMSSSAVSCQKIDKPDFADAPYIKINDEFYNASLFNFFDNDEDEGIYYSICGNTSDTKSRLWMSVPYAYCNDKTWDITTIQRTSTCDFRIEMRTDSGVETAFARSFKSGTFKAFTTGSTLTIEIDAITNKGTKLEVKCINVKGKGGPYVIPIF